MDDYEEGYRHAREAIFYHAKDLRVNWRGKATLHPLYGDPRRRRMSLGDFVCQEVSYRYRPAEEWSSDFQRGIQAEMARSLGNIASLFDKPHLVFGQAARDAVSPEYMIEKIKRMRNHPLLHRLGILKLAEALRL